MVHLDIASKPRDNIKQQVNEFLHLIGVHDLAFDVAWGPFSIIRELLLRSQDIRCHVCITFGKPCGKLCESTRVFCAVLEKVFDMLPEGGIPKPPRGGLEEVCPVGSVLGVDDEAGAAAECAQTEVKSPTPGGDGLPSLG